MGRYLTPDPIGQLGGIDSFSYVQNDPLKKIDTFGLWWTSGHSDLSRRAISFFSTHFSGNDLARIIAINTGVDITNPAENAAHYMPGTMREAEAIIARNLNLAVRMELAGHHDWAMYFLAAGLHTVQDRYAHCEQDAGWGDHIKGNKHPDDPLAHPLEYEKALEASIEYINLFVKSVTLR